MQSVRANRAKVGAEQTFGLVEEKKKKIGKKKSLKIGHNCCARRAGSTTQPADWSQVSAKQETETFSTFARLPMRVSAA